MDVRMPDGTVITGVPDDITQSELLRRYELSKKPQPTPEGGFIPAIKAGASELSADVAALAGRTGLISPESAERYIEEQKEYQRKTFKPTQEGWSEAPWTKFKETLGGSLPYAAAPVAAGAAALTLPVSAPTAALVGTAGAGLTSLAQFAGSNLMRQVEEGKSLQETSLGAATAAAVPQAALDVIGFKLIPGIRRIFSAAGKEVPDEVALAIAKQNASQIAKDYAKATGVAMGAEGLTEVGQQVLERLQAGLEIADQRARDEYFESFIGGAVLGGALSPAGRYIERSSQARKEQAAEEERLAKEQEEKNKPKLIGYDPASKEPMFVFPDGSVAIGEDAARARRYQPQPVETTVEPPKLLGYTPGAGKDRMYVFSDGSVAIGDDAAFARRYEAQKLSPEELSAIAPDLEGVEFQPVDQPPLPLTPEEEAELAAAPARRKADQQRIAELEQRYKALTSRAGKGESLRDALAGILSASEVADLGTEPYYKNTFGAKKGQEGRTIADMVADKSLDDWLPEDYRINDEIDSPETIADKEAAATEYIKEKLRNRDFRTFAADMEARGIDDELRGIREEIEREAGFENLRDILADIYEEEIARGFEPGESEYAPSDTRQPLGATGESFALTQETEQERALREAEEARVREEREAKAIADRERDAFNLTPQTPEISSPPTGDLFGAKGLAEQPQATPSAAPLTDTGLFAPQVAPEAAPQPAPEASSPEAAPQAATPQVDPEQQKATALKLFETRLSMGIPRFRMQSPNGRVAVTAPKPLSQRQINLLLSLAKEAIDLGLPPSLLNNVSAAGTTGQSNGAAIAAARGWLMLGKEWGPASQVEKLHTLIHELAHTVDFKSVNNRYSISTSSEWAAAHAELEGWYKREPNAKNPLTYPFSDYFKKTVPDTRTESFPQAFGLYFTDPVALQENAPTAYSAIQSIVERINNEPATTGAAGPAETGPIRTEVREARAEKGPEVQPDAGKVSPDVGRAERVQDRRVEAELIPVDELVNLKPSAALEALKRAGQRKQAPAEKLTSEGESAKKILETLGTISNPKPKAADETLLKRLQGKFTPTDNVSWEARFRRAIVDKDAPVIEQLQTQFNNAIKDELGQIRPDLALMQGQDVSNFSDLMTQKGGIRIGKDGLINTFEAKDANGKPINMDRVLELIAVDLGKKLGSADLAMQLAHNALIAFRSSEIIKNNQQIRVRADNMRSAAARLMKSGNAADKTLAKKMKSDADSMLNNIVEVRASQQEIDAGLEAMRMYPEIKEAYDVFTAYKNNLVDFLLETGRINELTAKNWKENVGYVPWTRVEEETNKFELDPRSFKNGVVNLSALPKLDKEGSSKEINNIFDNMVGLTYWAVRSGVNNYAAQKTLSALPDVEIIPEDRVSDMRQKHPDRVVFSYTDGERQAYLLANPFQLSTFSTIAPIKGGMFSAIFAPTARFLRATITHMPAFAISQLIQDGTYRAALLSGVKNPWKLPPKVFKNFYKALRKQKDGALGELERIGVSGIYDGMPEASAKKLRQRLNLEHRNAFKKAWDALEDFSLAADLAVRSAIYEQTMAETGDRALAYYRAKEYINFKRQGTDPIVYELRQSIPFFNAYLQGMDVLYRTMTGKGVKTGERKAAMKLFYTTGIQIAALNILYTMMMSGDDDYEGLDDYVRNRNYILPGGFKLPVAPEVGFLFKVIPEQLYRAVMSEGVQTPQDATAVAKRLTGAFADAFGGVEYLPQLVKPIIEISTNYSFFLESPIVGSGLRNVDPALQFTESTSELAKTIGGMANISPVKLDYFIRAYTGMAGALGLELTDSLMNPDRMGKPLYKIPQVSTFMYDPTGRGFKSDFYKFREEIDKVADTVNMMKREGKAEELAEYLTEEKATRFAMRGMVNKVEAQLSKLRNYRKVIAADTTLSPAERREMVREILDEERELIKAYDVKELRKIGGF